MGYQAWLPALVHTARTTRSKRTRAQNYQPVVFGLLFAAIPEAVHGDLQRVRHFIAVDRDLSCTAIRIPAIEIQLFMESVTDWNNRELHRIANGAKGRPARKPWSTKIRLEPGNLPVLMQALFGGQPDETG